MTPTPSLTPQQGEEAELNPLALEALENNQRQLDMDGVEVGVSRQALDELLSAYKAAVEHVNRAAELLAGLSAFDHMIACHVGIGYFDGTEITKEWDHLVRPSMERLKAASLSPAPTSGSEAGGLHGPCGYLTITLGLDEEHWRLSDEPENDAEHVSLAMFTKEDPFAYLPEGSATPAPSPAGGVREAAELLSHLKLYVLEKLEPADADMLHDRMHDLTRALSPATAAREG